MSDFLKLCCTEGVQQVLVKQGIIDPTDIQWQAIPLIAARQDVIGQAPTGTGKTLAYVLPLLQKLQQGQLPNEVIIIAPTYELAAQIHGVANGLIKAAELPITTALIVGSGSIVRQMDKLKSKPRLIIGSSGRIVELIKKKKIHAPSIRTLVIDEADRLFSDEQLASVKELVKSTLKDRQILCFSATFSVKTLNIAKEIMHDPVVVRTTTRPTIPSSVSHFYFVAERRDKFEILRKLIGLIQPQQALVFVNSGEAMADVTAKLCYHGLKAAGLHGGNGKQDRKQTVQDVLKGKTKILVASDIAARGLDFPDLTHVFQLDFPETPHAYLHRAGRTGRAGKVGVVISIVTAREAEELHKTAGALAVSFTEKKLLKGKIVDLK
jgi:ATP-dependent RNA helicase DeaD